VPLKGDGSAERSFNRSWRTIKENLLLMRNFASIEEMRQALLLFRETYNAIWLIERHGFRPPPAAIRKEQLPSVDQVA
jgi:hypothetical protein